jgi:hypothetical protein
MEKEAAPSIAGLGFQQLVDLQAKGLGLEEIEKFAEAGFTFEQMETFADARSTPVAAGGLSKDDLRDIITAAAKSASEAGAEGMRKVLHPQNAQHPGISAFSYPEGDVAHPKPALQGTVYFCGVRQDPAQMTPREIEAFNAITHSCSARDGRWTADFLQNGRDRELHVMVPCKSIDDRMNLPSMELICRELTQGPRAVDPTALADRVAELEKQLALRVPVAAQG